MKYPLFAVVAVALFITMTFPLVSAQDDDSAVDEPATEEAAPIDEVGLVDVIGDITDAQKSGDKKGIWIAVLALVALVIKAVVDLASGPLLPKGKSLRWAAVILGAIAGGISILVSGLQGTVATLPAVLMFLSGPLAVAFHELGKDVPVLAQISNFLAALGAKKG